MLCSLWRCFMWLWCRGILTVVYILPLTLHFSSPTASPPPSPPKSLAVMGLYYWSKYLQIITSCCCEWIMAYALEQPCYFISNSIKRFRVPHVYICFASSRISSFTALACFVSVGSALNRPAEGSNAGSHPIPPSQTATDRHSVLNVWLCDVVSHQKPGRSSNRLTFFF